VQIGSAFASSLGQVVHMSESRLRILVACGAAGGISATFNAPLTGVFFGFELILREFSIDALFPIIMAAVMADVIGQAFFGSGPIFSAMPHHLALPHVADYLLVALLALGAALIGVGFKTVLYGTEDVCDRLWRGRPEWCRPAFGGVVLGAVLLALPQLYGVGYPVMNRAVADHYVLWFLILLALGKVAAASLTIGIGGSGGVFAPSLFTGAMAGTAFGVAAVHVFGPAVGSPAIYGVIAMGAVFAAAAQAPLTSIASVVEMTGNYALILPVMFAVALAVGVSKRLTHGTIYTTKLLRRGTDIDRPKPSSMLQVLTVDEIMQPLGAANGRAALSPLSHDQSAGDRLLPSAWVPQFGNIVDRRPPQALFGEETLEQALRQLVLYGPDGLPVVSPDRHHVVGWISYGDVVRAMAERTRASDTEVAAGTLASQWATPDAGGHLHVAPAPLEGYEIMQVTIRSDSPGIGRPIDEASWPPGSIVVAVSQGRELVTPRPDMELRAGQRVVLLARLEGSQPTDDKDGARTSASQ
jgi:CIC family chloride channel protein